HDITICVLDNSTTAMTGGQPHPGTGAMLMGPQTESLTIEGVLGALGGESVQIANPHDLQESIDAITRAVSFEGPSAVIFRAPCVNLFRSAQKAHIDGETCTGCKRCITSIGCPAIGYNGKVAVIDPAQCNGCGLCTQVCPFDAIMVGGAE
ncbi:MAG: 4Fe-4S binding protein, partial [Eggerthellaceae bacterium]|nr:4Fe-4S binding protein [Eggerthellaceae bacterium]